VTEHDAAQISKTHRDRGNKYYSKKEFAPALKEYTASLFSAPFNKDGQSREASLGLGNRSAVHFEMGCLSECLDDIEAALMFGYPKELRLVILLL
jgi:hypothetical protein